MPHNSTSNTMAESIVRPASGAVFDPYRGEMVHIQVPQTIHHGPHHHGSVMMVYVPTSAHHAHSQVPTSVIPAMHVMGQCGEARPIVGSSYSSQGHSSDDETATTSNRAQSASFDSQHDAVSEKRKSPFPEPESSSSKDADTSVKVPFKKRKMVSQIIRPKDETGNCHVSPVSHGSKTDNSNSPTRTPNSSYGDMKGGHALHESSKINPNDTIPPPKTVDVPHFPSLLFDLLKDPVASENAIQWCTDGRAWRIVRWDALRKSVLPKFFGGASVDTFLADISSWGFEEVAYGADAGAYVHTFFRRGFPNLCKEIEKVGEGSNKRVKRSRSPGGSATAPSILQVPSLGDAVHSDAKSEEISRAPSSPAASGSTGNTSPVHTWSMYPPVYMQYSQETASAPQTAAWTPVHTSPTASAYSPGRVVRSGRGAGRLPARLPVQVTPNANRFPGGMRSRFPVVSNRGRRTGNILRSSGSIHNSPSGAACMPSPTTPNMSHSPVQSMLQSKVTPAHEASPTHCVSKSLVMEREPLATPATPPITKRIAPAAANARS